MVNHPKSEKLRLINFIFLSSLVLCKQNKLNGIGPNANPTKYSPADFKFAFFFITELAYGLSISNHHHKSSTATARYRTEQSSAAESPATSGENEHLPDRFVAKGQFRQEHVRYR
jgi:hypothetical protein